MMHLKSYIASILPVLAKYAIKLLRKKMEIELNHIHQSVRSFVYANALWQTVHLVAQNPPQNVQFFNIHEAYSGDLQTKRDSLPKMSNYAFYRHCFIEKVCRLSLTFPCPWLPGEPWLPCARVDQQEHTGAHLAHVRRCPAADLHTNAKRLVSPLHELPSLQKPAQHSVRAVPWILGCWWPVIF